MLGHLGGSPFNVSNSFNGDILHIYFYRHDMTVNPNLHVT